MSRRRRAAASRDPVARRGRGVCSFLSVFENAFFPDFFTRVLSGFVTIRISTNACALRFATALGIDDVLSVYDGAAKVLSRFFGEGW